MTSSTQNKPVSLSSWHCGNWTPGANPAPPVILNPQATIHAAIAWTWGEVAQLQQLCDSEPGDIETAYRLIHARMPAITAMMERLGDRTRHMSETMEVPR